MEQPNGVKADQAITRACDVCRKKKIRCEPTKEGCVQCKKSRSLCHFTPIRAKKRPRRPPGHKNITALEERLKKLEGLLGEVLQGSNLEISEREHGEISPFGVFDSTDRTVKESERVSQHLPFEQANWSEHDMRMEDNNFETSLSISPWFQNGTPGRVSLISPTSFTPAPTNPLPSWKGGLALGPFSLPSFHELPPKSVALELICDAFKSFNNFFQLFDEDDFLRKFHRNYLNSSPSNPTWWACINVVFSLAHRFRAMRLLDSTHENAESCGYIHNALAVVSELSILHNSLPAIQALVGMATILQGTPNPEPASVLIAAAVRLAQAMGLHRKTRDPSLSNAEVEQRQRVFWFAYLLDKDISLRMGQPFAQDDDDMDAELPMGNPSRLSQYSDKPQTIDFFSCRVGLAVIQGQIYKRLYSVQAARQSDVQRAAVASELGIILSYWRRGVWLDFGDGALAADQQTPFTIEFVHLLVLHATYVNCLVMIDRHLPTHEQLLAGDENQRAIMPPERESVIESRKALRLVQITPHGDYACVWLLLHPFFAAVTTILNNVLCYPGSAQAHTDLHIVEPFVALLDVLSSDERRCSRSEEAKRMRQACHELNDRAKDAVNAISGGLLL